MGKHARPEAVEPARRADGLEMLGQTQGSGYSEPTYLVRRPDGQVLQLSYLLYLTLSQLDGRPDAEAAAAVSQALGRELTPDGLRYLVDNKLAPLHLVGPHEAPTADHSAAKDSDPVLSLAGRRTLVPAGAVRRAASIFHPFFWAPVVMLVLEAVVLADFWMFGVHDATSSLQAVIAQPEQLLLVIALLVASMFFHEFGHAAGCQYGGAKPGVIGAGLYLVFPAFYTDVTDAYRLGRAGRLRTDLGGVYFNLIFLLGLAAGYALTGWDALVVAAILTHFEILQQLLPIVRLDGYFIVGDLVGVPNLFRWVKPILLGLIPGRRDPEIKRLRPWVRWVVAAWVFLVVPVLAVNVWILVITGPEMVSTTADTVRTQSRELSAALHSLDLVTATLSALSIIALLLPLMGLWVLATRIGAQARRRLVAWAKQGRRQRFAAISAVAGLALVVAWTWLPAPQTPARADPGGSAGTATPTTAPSAAPPPSVTQGEDTPGLDSNPWPDTRPFATPSDGPSRWTGNGRLRSTSTTPSP